MSKQQLSMNFNVFDNDAPRQELQKAQVYINNMNTQVEALSSAITDLQTSLNTLTAEVQKYIADHP